ncbi:MAG: S41 family peptidase [Candidatus Pacebacteria bacterium]|jgi:carboxyl-terminal processing protease|nr:S41 family peptidase [Candidatus Paceibacterota bacterium]
MKQVINKSYLITISVLALVTAFTLGIQVGENKTADTNTLAAANTEAEARSLDLAPLWKTLEVLDARFVPTTASSSVPTSQEKVYGAIAGLTSAYGDPYTVFFPPEEADAFEEEVRGSFEGVGMEIAIKDNVLTVVAPLKNTPAERAGMKPGDQIIKIDKTFTSGMTVENAIKIIRGPRGTTVTLVVKRNGGVEDIKVVRDVINIPTIDTKLRDDGVFVISLYNFSANSANLFRGALREFIQSGSDKLVLDLRSNPGGYLEAAVDMASFFLPMGKTVVIEDSGANTKQKPTRSKGYDVFTENLKMVVLLDGGSASASEILAGALHEHGVAKLVGEKSFGKGSVQELIEITPGTALKVTIAKWLTPKGKSISENGLEPDVKVTISKKDAEKKIDTQMEKAVEILKDPEFKR